MPTVGDFKELGARIREVRLGFGWNQEQLANAVAIERSALSRIESGERKVSALELTAIADSLGISFSDLITVPEPDARATRRPVDEEFSARDAEEFKANIELDRAWRDALKLREMRVLPQTDQALQTLFSAFKDEDSARRAAHQIRSSLGLGTTPIDSMSNLAARLGLWCRTTRADIDGMSMSPETGFGVAVIGLNRPPGRRRQTAAHELGHHVCADTYTANSYVHPRESEKLINVFASELLIPTEVLRTTTDLTRDDLIRIAGRYRVSWSLLAKRIEELRIRGRDDVFSQTPTDRDFLRVLGYKPAEDLVQPGLADKWVVACARAEEKSLITARRANEMTLGVLEVDR